MRLNLHEIIGAPGAHVTFDYEPDLSDCSAESAYEVLLPSRADGEVRNAAGVLMLTARLETTVLCNCARCLKEQREHISLNVEAMLAESLQDEDNPDIFLLDGNFVDLDEVIRTVFMLEMPQRFLCGDDCKGLCDQCGNNLNDGSCNCATEADPRLAVLKQLLEK